MKKLFAFPLAALVCACTGRGGTEEAAAPLDWGTEEVSIERPIAPGETLCYQIKVQLDTLQGTEPLAQQLSAVLRDSVLFTARPTVRQSMVDYADSTETEWKTMLLESYSPDAEYKDMFQYYLSVSGHPLEATTDGVLSYRTQLDCYLGGAHGSSDIHYYNFDVQTGRQIGLDDVIPADKRKEVLAAMMQRLCADNGVPDQTALQEQTGITMLGDLYLTSNFLLRGDSIQFLFGQYEIAPYASGIISVTVPRP